MTLRPCLGCGEPTDRTRCPGCQPADQRPSSTRRGYDAAWRRLSQRARRLQPFCDDCGAVADLTTDHTTEAWERHAAGLPIRLQDVAVVCRSCNARRGRAKPVEPRGDTPSRGTRRPTVKAQGALHTPGGIQ